MTVLIEILPLMCGIFVSFLLRLFALNQTNKYALLGILSLFFGIITNQMAGEPVAFVLIDTFYVALSAVVSGVFVKQLAHFRL